MKHFTGNVFSKPYVYILPNAKRQWAQINLRFWGLRKNLGHHNLTTTFNGQSTTSIYIRGNKKNN